MDGQTYWEQIGHQKDFEDPFPLGKLSEILSKEAHVVEYGCGYGRLLHQMEQAGFTHLRGFDYSSKMIERGKEAHPHLELTHIPESGHIPLKDRSVDCLLASTILCCLPQKDALKDLFKEFHRVLKPGGLVYLFDFLLSSHPSSQKKYESGLQEHGEWGVYTTNEGLKVRHFKTSDLMELLADFDIQWFEQLDFKTMNNNPARVFQCFAKRV